MRCGDAAETRALFHRVFGSLAERLADSPASWHAVVVVDDQPAAAVWADTADSFVELLRESGAFVGVSVRHLHAGGADRAQATLGDAGGGSSSAPAGLTTESGRRVMFVLTDGTAPAWHSGAALSILRDWASQVPVVVVHLLPQQHWYRTGVRPLRMRLTPSGPTTPNTALAWQLREAVPDVLDDDVQPVSTDSVPVPVLELCPHWFSAWVRLFTGEEASLPALLARPAPPRTTLPREPDRAPDARSRVRRFTSWATPTALALATHLAAAPLNLPVMRLVQRELVPGSDASHLSEILNSGLVRPVSATATVTEPHRVTFEFERGVREELLAVGRRADAVRVLRVVDRYLGSSVPAVRGLSQVIDDPDQGPDRSITPESRPFVRVEQAVLQALSGRYLARSRRLGAALGATTDAPASPPVTAVDPAPATDTSIDTGGAGVPSSPATETTASKRASTKSPIIWGNVPPRNPNFTGRETLLEHLHERMRAGTTAVLPHALHGMGGVGKSQLAVEYVYRHQADYDLIWWIPAERPAQIGAGLAELAQRLGLPVGLEANTAVPAVREALRLGRPYANWLLIFDNAESPEAVRGYFPTGGPGSIMVTSRNPQWANIARPLEVDVFAREESVELLRRRGPDLSDEDADRLAEALGDLPLALEQAAAWRAETGMTTDEYLRLFDEKRTELLEVSAPMDYQLPVAAAWNVSLDRLVVSSPAAVRLLQVCSFFAPEPIPRVLFSRTRATKVHPELSEVLRDPMRLNRAIREINRYALAKIDHRTNSIQMHRLVQAVLVDRLSPEEQESMRQSALLMLADSDPNDPNSQENWRVYAELYPHLMASEAYASTDPWVQQLVDNTAKYLYWWGDHEAGYDLAQRAYDARREQVGATDPATLRIGHWLGFMFFVLGRFGEAARFNAELLEAYQEISEEDTEELLKAIGAVAADRRVAGDFQGALEMAEDVYRRHIQALGEEDPETLNAAHNLAVSLRLTGDLQRAYDLDYRNQQLRVSLYGADHPVTLETTRTLIIDRRELGDYVGARAEAEAVVDRLRLQLSPGHPQTLRAMRSLSTAIRKAGDHQAARAVSEEVQEGFLTRYGDGHPDTVAASLNLAIDLRQTGDLDAAAELAERVAERYRDLVGDQHPHTIAARLNLAVAQRLRGYLSEAQRLDEDGYTRLHEQLGPDHPLTLAAAVNLASDLYAQGQFAAAYERDADSVERLRQVLGPDHPTTLAGLGNLVMDLMALGREDEARPAHADVIERFQRTLGDDHPATAVAADLTVRANTDLDPMPL